MGENKTACSVRAVIVYSDDRADWRAGGYYDEDDENPRVLGGRGAIYTIAGRSVRRVCFPLDAKRMRQGSTARNVSGARTHKKNGRQNPRASYFTVCQAVRGFYNITDKQEEELRSSKRIRRRRHRLRSSCTSPRPFR